MNIVKTGKFISNTGSTFSPFEFIVNDEEQKMSNLEDYLLDIFKKTYAKERGCSFKDCMPEGYDVVKAVFDEGEIN
jgi:hypothetical protein